jgi:hypothetical protein
MTALLHAVIEFNINNTVSNVFELCVEGIRFNK